MNLKTTTVDQLVQRANDSLGSDIAEGLRETFPQMREQALAQRQVSAPVSVDRLRFKSTKVKFEVDPALQQYK